MDDFEFGATVKLLDSFDKIPLDLGEVKWFACSSCNHDFTVLTDDEDGDVFEIRPMYCPFCGEKFND